MKSFFNNLTGILIFFFTPEDSTNTINSRLSFDIESGTLNLGSLKAMFWLANAFVFMFLMTLL